MNSLEVPRWRKVALVACMFLTTGTFGFIQPFVPLFLQGRVVRAYAGPKQVILVPDGTHNGEIPLKTEREIATAIQQMLRPPVPARY